ncbi:hypothetical protein Tco_1292492 [Tanacetum coccineum]
MLEKKGPSRKRRRSPMTYVPALSPVSGVLSYVRADLIPSPNRVKDSGYLADVEVDPMRYYMRDDAIVKREAVGDTYRRLRDLVQRKMPNTRSGASMTHEEIEELIARRVAEEIEAREAAMTPLNPCNEKGITEAENGGNGKGGNGVTK